jgi:hypothetical protein
MSILDKVRKLRALAQSDNVNEAAAAAAAAERLIQEHNLSEAEITIQDAPPEACSADPTVIATWGRSPAWEGTLLAVLRRLYHCSALYVSGYQDDGKTVQRYTVFGRPSDIETLRYQFAWYSAEINRITAKASRGKGRTFANSFRLGTVDAICKALLAVQTETRAAATSTALAVVDKRAQDARTAMRTHFPRTVRRGVGGGRINRDAFGQGQEAGRGIGQRTALGNAGGVRLLGSGR